MKPSTIVHKAQPFTKQSLVYIEDFLGRIPEPYSEEISSLLKPGVDYKAIRKKILLNSELQKVMLSALREHFRDRKPLDEDGWRFKDYSMPEYLVLLINIYSSQKQGFSYSVKNFESSYIQVIKRDFPFEKKKPEEKDQSKD